MVLTILMKSIKYSYGNLHLYEHYCHLDLGEATFLSLKQCQDVLADLDTFYKKRPHVIISDRKFTASVDTKSYKYVNHKRMVGIAVVTSNENAKQELVKEQELYGGSFAFFKTVEAAKEWAGNFVESYAD